MSGAPEALAKARPMVEAPLRFRLKPGGRKARNGSFLICPKCNAPSFIRDSEYLSERVTQMICHCTDSACGHTYRADIVFVHTLVPGNIDRPDLDLPVCEREKVAHVRPPGHDADENEPTFFDPHDTAATDASSDTG